MILCYRPKLSIFSLMGLDKIFPVLNENANKMKKLWSYTENLKSTVIFTIPKAKYLLITWAELWPPPAKVHVLKS